MEAGDGRKAYSGAAPATVSGELLSDTCHWGLPSERNGLWEGQDSGVDP